MPSKKRATPISLQPLDGMQIKKEDYKLVYVGELSGNMSWMIFLKGSTLIDRKISVGIPCLSVIS